MTYGRHLYERTLAKRALLTALGPLAGERATGQVIATATGAPVVMPPFTYGIPIIDGAAVYARMVRVQSITPVNVEPEGPEITNAGLAVEARSVCGGSAGNLPEGTPILWQPLPGGIEAYGVVGPGGITGGIDTPGPGRCARVVAFDTLPSGEPMQRFWEARGEGFPAIAIARVGSVPQEARTVASVERAHTFRIYVVCTNYESNDERQGEAELLLDAIEGTLEGLADVEGEVFGSPIETGAERAEGRSPSSHVFSIDCTVDYALVREDVRLTDGVSWQPWLTTRIQTTEPATGTQDPVVLVDTTHEQEQ